MSFQEISVAAAAAKILVLDLSHSERALKFYCPPPFLPPPAVNNDHSLTAYYSGLSARGGNAISPPTHVICTPYFFIIYYILCNISIIKQFISPPTLADAPPTSKVADNPDYSQSLNDFSHTALSVVKSVLTLSVLCRDSFIYIVQTLYFTFLHVDQTSSLNWYILFIFIRFINNI